MHPFPHYSHSMVLQYFYICIFQQTFPGNSRAVQFAELWEPGLQGQLLPKAGCDTATTMLILFYSYNPRLESSSPLSFLRRRQIRSFCWIPPWLENILGYNGCFQDKAHFDFVRCWLFLWGKRPPWSENIIFAMSICPKASSALSWSLRCTQGLALQIKLLYHFFFPFLQLNINLGVPFFM